MIVKYSIGKTTGEIETEVIDREEHLCSDAYKVASLVGTIVEDVETGPEGDEVHEIVT